MSDALTPRQRQPVGLDAVAEDAPCGPTRRSRSRGPHRRSPSVRLVPVAGDGHASRTNQTSAGVLGAGQRQRAARSRQAERHQPVAPVPVADQHAGGRLRAPRRLRRRQVGSARSGGRWPRKTSLSASSRWPSSSPPRPSCARRRGPVRGEQPGEVAGRWRPARRRCGRAPGRCRPTGWPSRYFATLATSPSWPDDDDDVVGLEQEPVQVGALHLPRRQSAGIARPRSSGLRASGVPGLDLVDVPAPALRKNAAWPRVPCRASSSSYSVRRRTTTTRGASAHDVPARPAAPAAPAPGDAGRASASGCSI